MLTCLETLSANPNFNKFSTSVKIELESEGFLVKTATTQEDYITTLKLRHLTFIEEGLGTTTSTGYDFDDYDYLADHLLIYDIEKNQTVGTYRLICSSFSDRFYSQNEFFMDDFLKIEGGKLELGRACVHPEYRNGRMVDLLWQGLSKYITTCQVRYLFGCSSLKTEDANEVMSILKALEKNEQVSQEFNIRPVPDYSFPDAEIVYKDALPFEGVTRALPPLLRSYLHAGSLVHGMPAWDRDFKCTDMLTVLDIRNLNKKFQERYNPVSG